MAFGVYSHIPQFVASRGPTRPLRGGGRNTPSRACCATQWLGALTGGVSVGAVSDLTQQWERYSNGWTVQLRIRRLQFRNFVSLYTDGGKCSRHSRQRSKHRLRKGFTGSPQNVKMYHSRVGIPARIVNPNPSLKTMYLQQYECVSVFGRSTFGFHRGCGMDGMWIPLSFFNHLLLSRRSHGMTKNAVSYTAPYICTMIDWPLEN